MLLRATLLAAILYTLPTGAHVFSTPNCTLPPAEMHNFVAAPQIRGTLEILWTCLATIIACTYTVLHLNVPEQRDGRDRGWKGNLRWWWKGIWPSLKWTMVTMLAPEVYTYIAIHNLFAARATLRDLKDLPKSSCPDHEWTLVHAFFVNMGGFSLRPNKPDESQDRVPLICLHGKTLMALLKERVYTLQGVKMLDISVIPREADILDRSKSDLFAKSITLAQVTYFCVSCFARFGKHLHTTLLELGTLGFAACSVFTYALFFKKPRAVNSTITLTHWEKDVSSKAADIIKKNGPLARIPTNDFKATFSNISEVAMLVLATALGAIHTAGWNFAFPTVVDKWVWRSCSVASTACPLFLLIVVYLFAAFDNLFGTSLEDSKSWENILTMIFASYSVFRLILIVEMIRCLFFLPPEAFATTWAANAPHIG